MQENTDNNYMYKPKNNKLTSQEKIDCANYLKNAGMFSFCSENSLLYICSFTKKELFKKNQILYKQDTPQDSMAIIASGKLARHIQDSGKQNHISSFAKAGDAVGSQHVLRKDLSSTTCRCATDVIAYVITSENLNKALEKPQVAQEIVYSLNREIRRQAKLLQTPLLEQHPKPTPYFAASVAASVESFYRSALNASLNSKLTGQPASSLFPNMSVQIPTRVLYINGFKGIRHFLDNNVDAETYKYPELTRVAAAMIPGVIMTPISSILEACNAGHMNPEALHKRWLRGLIPRGLREIIFGVGLNQLSDYFEERALPLTANDPLISNALGSIGAGIVAGYFSHVPHNLSTLKLMNPQKSYLFHLYDLIKCTDVTVPTDFLSFLSQKNNKKMRFISSTILAILFPRGLAIRTVQIVGSFMILNGTIYSLQEFDPREYIKKIKLD